MVKLKHLLLENPDTLKYEGKYYRYTSPANRSAFLVYYDKETLTNELFGYSDIQKDFFASADGLIKQLKEYEDNPDNSDNSEYITKFRKRNYGGGHSELEAVLQILKRSDGDSKSRARLFEVDSGEGKKIHICSFWDNKASALKYLDFWKQAIELNGFKPEEILYEPYKGVYTYEQFVDADYVVRPDKVQISRGDFCKVGDVVVYAYNSSDGKDPYNPRGVIDSIIDEDRVAFKITHVANQSGRFFVGNIIEVYPRDLIKYVEEPQKPEQPPVSTQSTQPQQNGEIKVGDTVKFAGLELYAKILEVNGTRVRLQITKSYDGAPVNVGDLMNYSSDMLTKVSTTSVEEPIAPILDSKTDLFVDKRAQLHTTAATFTPQEKQNLEREVDTLELEIKKLQSFIESGITTLNDERKKELEQYVKHELAKRHAEKKDRYSLAAQAEKQYGMPIAQIRQKYRGVPLDQLVKKESLYKKMMRHHIMMG